MVGDEDAIAAQSLSVYGLRTFLTDCRREILDGPLAWLLRL